jgi:hypothetical protein
MGAHESPSGKGEKHRGISLAQCGDGEVAGDVYAVMHEEALLGRE